MTYAEAQRILKKAKYTDEWVFENDFQKKFKEALMSAKTTFSVTSPLYFNNEAVMGILSEACPDISFKIVWSVVDKIKNVREFHIEFVGKK